MEKEQEIQVTKQKETQKEMTIPEEISTPSVKSSDLGLKIYTSRSVKWPKSTQTLKQIKKI